MLGRGGGKGKQVISSLYCIVNIEGFFWVKGTGLFMGTHRRRKQSIIKRDIGPLNGEGGSITIIKKKYIQK